MYFNSQVWAFLLGNDKYNSLVGQWCLGKLGVGRIISSLDITTLTILLKLGGMVGSSMRGHWLNIAMTVHLVL